MAIDYEARQNDLAEFIRVQLTKNGVAVDLTAAEEVLMHMRQKGAPEPITVTDIVMDIAEAAEGKIEHRWQTGENADAITFEVEFEVIWIEEKRNSSFPSGALFYEIRFNEEIK